MPKNEYIEARYPENMKDWLDEVREKGNFKNNSELIECLVECVMRDESKISEIFNPEDVDYSKLKFVHERLRLPSNYLDFLSVMKKHSMEMQGTAGSLGMFFALRKIIWHFMDNEREIVLNKTIPLK